MTFQFQDGTNSGGAIRGTAEGTLDLAVVNRPLSDAESKEQLTYRAFARDAVVFAVNGSSGLKQVSTGQLQEIYGGKVTRWNEMGGSGAEIVALDRDEDESARKLVFLPIMGSNPVKARTVVLNKAKAMLDALESTPNSIGYSSLGLLRLTNPHNVQVLALDGVTPEPDTIANRTYPWQLTFGLVYHNETPGQVADFVQYAVGSDGQKILRSYGYANP